MADPSAFPTTKWSLVLKAQGTEIPDSALALASLCEAYWYPLYAFLRRRGENRDDALDRTQGFFERLIEKRTLADLRPGSGRFRSFLLSSFKHYAANERERDQAHRRGGGRVVLSLDGEIAERRYGRELQDTRTPDRAYDRAWARTVLERAHERLRRELEASGKRELFVELGPALTDGRPARPHREVAALLGISEDAVKMTLLRLRRRFGRLLRDEIAETVGDARAVDEELRHLLSILRDG
jgi:RNA polymerase sigma factor (sigma-70 family)